MPHIVPVAYMFYLHQTNEAHSDYNTDNVIKMTLHNVTMTYDNIRLYH